MPHLLRLSMADLGAAVLVSESYKTSEVVGEDFRTKFRQKSAL